MTRPPKIGHIVTTLIVTPISHPYGRPRQCRAAFRNHLVHQGRSSKFNEYNAGRIHSALRMPPDAFHAKKMPNSRRLGRPLRPLEKCPRQVSQKRWSCHSLAAARHWPSARPAESVQTGALGVALRLTRSQLCAPGGALGIAPGNTRALPTDLQRALPWGMQRNRAPKKPPLHLRRLREAVQLSELAAISYPSTPGRHTSPAPGHCPNSAPFAER